MAFERVSLRAGGRAGWRVVTWAQASDATLVGRADAQAAGYRTACASGVLAGTASLTTQAYTAKTGRASITALATNRLAGDIWHPSRPSDITTYRRYTRDDYHKTLLDLMPRGRAWPRDGEDGQLMYAWSAELERVEQRGWQLLEEWDPRTTTELFTDWEGFFELPGTGSEEERRQQLIAEWLEGGTLSRDDIDGLLDELGVDATVKYCREFRVGISTVGDALATGWHSTWIVYVHNPESVDIAWLQDFLSKIAPAGDYVIVVAQAQPTR
ncbi:hypothetical protein NM74_07815 [Aeromonas hydrophila]|uniref:putative phage tail protein n=1 Tax=Aeromonas hydrophila TaxID=644 RepID=UPI0005380516|nr:putative phage tail protein [Aeromonas hydrophila]KHA57123.1 hypothetical protein NM74_07815 [Aeromonas hydrophila]